MSFGGVARRAHDRADESVRFTVPPTPLAARSRIFVRRSDGTESNRITVYIKPQLDLLSRPRSARALRSTLDGNAFLADASVLVNGERHPCDVSHARRQIKFIMPGTGGSRNGRRNRHRAGAQSRRLSVEHAHGADSAHPGSAVQVRSAQSAVRSTSPTASPIGARSRTPSARRRSGTSCSIRSSAIPILTAAFYVFYHHFLKGKANGGLATGFCTSLAESGRRSTSGRAAPTRITVTKDSCTRFLTACPRQAAQPRIAHSFPRSGAARRRRASSGLSRDRSRRSCAAAIATTRRCSSSFHPARPGMTATSTSWAIRTASCRSVSSTRRGVCRSSSRPERRR